MVVSKLLSLLRKRDFQFIIVLTFFVFLSSRALFHDGFFRTVDDITTVRINYMEKEIRRGNWLNNFPVRMSGELANYFSYPLYLFYAPLIYYVGAFLKISFSLSHIVATKYVYVFPLLFGSFAFYFAARQKMSSFPALVSSVFFTFFPYRGFNTYILGAAPQAWAISFIPAAMGGLFLLQNKKTIGGLVFGVSFFLILITHNLTGMLFGGFALLFGLLFLFKNKNFWIYLLLAIGLSAFFLLPMFYYLKIIRVTNLEINSTYILQTLEPISQFHKIYNLNGIPINHPGYKVSAVHILVLIVGLVFLIYKKYKGTKLSKEIWFWGGIGLLSYLSLFQFSSLFWQLTMPLTGILQFAWRLLAVLAFIIPFFLGLWFAQIRSLFLKGIVTIGIIAAIASFLPAFKPMEYSYYYEYYPEGECATTSWQDEYLPMWVKGCPDAREPFETLSKSEITVSRNDYLLLNAEIKTAEDTDLIVNKMYFPGWHLYVDGVQKPLDWNFSADGIFKTGITAGEHAVEAVYEKTPVMWIADAISLLSFATILYLEGKRIFRKKRG